MMLAALRSAAEADRRASPTSAADTAGMTWLTARRAKHLLARHYTNRGLTLSATLACQENIPASLGIMCKCVRREVFDTVFSKMSRARLWGFCLGVAISEHDYFLRARTNKHVYKRARCAFSLPRTATPCSLRMRRSARVSKRFDEMPFGVKLLSLVALAALSAPTVQPAAAAAAASAPSAKRARLVRAALLAARVPLSHAFQRPALSP